MGNKLTIEFLDNDKIDVKYEGVAKTMFTLTNVEIIKCVMVIEQMAQTQMDMTQAGATFTMSDLRSIVDEERLLVEAKVEPDPDIITAINEKRSN